MAFVTVARDGVPVTQARDVALDATLGKNFTLKTDVVVVGSGAAGALVAYEMAKAGRDVLVLEAGRYYPSAQFTEHLGDTMTKIYQDQVGQVNTTADVIFVGGACVGGSTVIGGCVMQQPSDAVFDGWAKRHELPQLSAENIKPYFDKVGEQLHVHTNEAHEINACAHKVIQGCEKMKFSWKPAQRNVKQCALTGHCLAGCPSDRKMSSLVTHLPWAAAYGARVFSDTEVVRVLTRNGRANGVEARITDPDSGAHVADMRVDADIVVLAAGAIQTPLIMQRSQLKDTSGQIGRNMTVQPFTQVLGKFPEPLYGFRGALVGVYVDEFTETDGYMILSGLAEPESLLAQGDMRAGKAHLEFMKDYKYYAGVNAFSVDSGRGYVQWDGDPYNGDKTIHWNPNHEEFENIKRSAALAARIFFSGGAEKVFLPTFQSLEADSVFNLDAQLDKVDYGLKGMYTFRANSFSPHGTCRMGADPYQYVVGPNGETHGTAGLFVADASLIPEPLVAPPQWTVQALAQYVSDRINQRADSLFLS
ncbi:GMC oxidoreductase family protein [Alcanivorax hongdengensis A-11-3]|uniref:GMC oxidoreductase family protein n=1 Tax=Alcanivorax hongdengensis A-11-3 TaxID=1177179 RepID=L0WDM5_9GAMM|nr:GMC family oxidoreductase [Alcanivorax hongdengensis]EKF75136.1 GMC oxidoreductase family protein [Alcanivorax hongdengensis A-11-3]